MGADDIAMRATLDAGGYIGGVDQMINKTNQLGISTGTMSTNLGGLGNIIGTLANPMAATATAAMAVGAALAGSVQAAASWETAMAGVAKTTGLGGSDLQGLSQQLLEMSTNMPVAASELAGIAEVAGSLGVAQENIAGFTEAAAMMGVAFSMPAEEAATAGAKILNAFNQPIDTKNMMALGNVVNAMGDSFAATEPQVLEFTNRASYLNTTFGLTIPQVAALGTVLISAGMSAETASTGIKSFSNMALKEGGAGAKALAELWGQTTEEVNKAFGEDFSGSMVKTADLIAQIEDPVEKFNTAVAIAGTEGAEALLKLAGKADTLQGALQKASQEWENGASMMKTFEANSSTLDSQWQMFTNTLMKAGVELGNVLLPSIAQGVEDLTKFTKAAIDAGEAIYSWTKDADKTVQGATDWYMGLMGFDLQSYKAPPEALDMGRMIGDTYAEGIKDSDLATAPGEVLSSDTALSGAAEAGKLSGDEWVKAFGSAAEAGMVYINGKWQSNSAGRNNERLAESAFEYLGKQFTISKETGRGSSRWWLTADGTKLGEDTEAIDPVEFFERLTGAPAPEKGTAEYFRLVFDAISAEKIEIQESLKAAKDEPLNLWEQWDTTRSWDTFLNENKELAKNTGDELTLVLYNAMGASMLKNEPTLTESMANIMQAIAEPGSVPATILNQAIADAVDAKVIEPQWADELIAAGTQAVEELAPVWGMIGEQISGAMAQAREGLQSAKVFQMLYGGTPEEQAQAKAWIADNVADQGQWYRSHFMAAASQYQSDAEKYGLAIPTAFWETLKGQWQSEGAWFDEDLAGRMNHLDWAIKEVFGSWENFEKNATLDQQIMALQMLQDELDTTKSKLADQTVGFNNLEKACEECSEAMSEFGQWQESQNNLFQESYIGPGGQSYLDWKIAQINSIAETQRAMKMVGGAVLGKDYTTFQLQYDMDTSKAESALQSIEDKAKEPIEGSFELKMDQAMRDLQRLESMASRPITKMVYLQEVGGPGYNGQNNYQSLSNPYEQLFYYPSYDEGTDYVPYDQLALIHKGEAVLTREENSGRRNVEVNVNVNSPLIEINGTTSEEMRQEFDAKLGVAVGTIRTEVAEAVRGL